MVSRAEAQPKRNKNNFTDRGAAWVCFCFYLSPAIAASRAPSLSRLRLSKRAANVQSAKVSWHKRWLRTLLSRKQMLTSITVSAVIFFFFFNYSVRITCQPLTTHCLCVNVHSSRPEEHDTREDKVKAGPQSPSSQLPGLCKLKQLLALYSLSSQKHFDAIQHDHLHLPESVQ